MKNYFVFALGILLIGHIEAQDKYPIETENPAVLQILTEAGIDIDDHTTYITYANPWKELLSINAPITFFEKLIALGQPIEPEFGNGIYESPLVLAIEKDNYELVDLLIKKGANVNREHQRKRTPLHFAAMQDDSRILNRLIDAGANVNKTDEQGYTPLHSVFQQFGKQNHYEKINILLTNKANINATLNNGMTPLMMAANSFMCTEAIIQSLLAGRPNINAVNAKKETALILAAKNTSRPQIITLLLNAGANAKLEDNTGRTALDWFDQNKRINKSPIRKELKDRM